MSTQAEKKLKVVVAGASGETGKSIVNALLASPDRFQVTALGRRASVHKDVYHDFVKRGAIVEGVDFQDIDALTAILQGADTVIACLTIDQAVVQDTLIEASYKAGVGRFVPSFFATSCPRGVMPIRDMKEASLDKIRTLYLPYTAIDVGWWYQFSIPRVPSGKLDAAITFPENVIAADGNVRTALTDLEDVGKFVARIIADNRTLNKQVFAYGEVTTQNKVISTVERYTGENIARQYLSKEEAEDVINTSAEAIVANPKDPTPYVTKAMMEYKLSRGIRGDNTPESAAYLGYLDARELYPDFKPKSVEDFVRELVEGSRTASLYVGLDDHALRNNTGITI
ncbi:isoflavone reductase [Fusarium sporotrichioides]|uniref:Isoflavone reductase n=1 Tax=Fusarium sporotrichioides TaxID=5514 RepID=A0A395S2Y1_FUSSP|nr:isoflavone reductase [Fusarium sporotrichioides]